MNSQEIRARLGKLDMETSEAICTADAGNDVSLAENIRLNALKQLDAIRSDCQHSETDTIDHMGSGPPRQTIRCTICGMTL